MLHDCPKCGFNQPKDQYCANCGIDIDRYAPAPKSFLSRFLENTGFQMALFALLLLGAASYIYFTQQQTITNTLSKAMSSDSLQSPETQDSVNFEVKKTGTVDNVDRLADMPESVSTDISNPAPKAEKNKPEKSLKPTRLKFNFSEAPASYVQNILTNGTLLNETQNTRSIYFIEKEAPRDIVDLPGGTSANITPDTPIRIESLRFVKGYTEEIGFLMDVEVTSADAEGIELEIQAYIRLPAENGAVTTTEFQAKYSFGTKGVLAIAGLVPQKSVQADAETALASTPLSIMSSPDFVGRSTEFVVFIRAE